MSTDTKAIVEKKPDTETTEKPFGKRWEAGTISLTNDDIAALQNGKYIALDIMNEYIVYLELHNEKR